MCGKELPPEARFCSGCGAPVSPSVPSSRSVDGGSSRDVSKIAIAILLVAITLVSACILLYSDDDVVQRTQGNVTITGGLVTDDISIVGDGLVYSGSGAQWLVMNLHASFIAPSDVGYVERGYDTVEGSNLSPGPGEYLVVLKVDGSEVGSGSLTIRGTIVNTYTWTAVIDGEMRSFSFDFPFTLDEYLLYSDTDDIRRQASVLSEARFVEVDAPILRLTDLLATEYRSVYGLEASLNDQRYADYLLSFVQCNMVYPPSLIDSDGGYVEDEGGSADMYLYGVDEYWAYPMETLFFNQGDCEDTSFLMCAIYSAAGYDSAIATIPRHMLVGVELESFDQRMFLQGVMFMAKRIPGHDSNLYFCETTYNKSVPVGYVSQSTNREISSLEEVTFVPHHTFLPEVSA